MKNEPPSTFSRPCDSFVNTLISLLLISAGAVSLCMALASPLLMVSCREVIGFGRMEFPVAEFAETLTIPKTVAELNRNGDVVLMLIVLCSCILFPALKMTILVAETFGSRSSLLAGIGRFLERWALLEVLLLAVYLAMLKADSHLEVHSGPAVGWLVASIILCVLASTTVHGRVKQRAVRLTSASLVLFTLASCSKPAYSYSVRLDDVGGVAVGSSVVWKGVPVGAVRSIKPEAGKLKVTIFVSPDFAGALHEGAIAEVPAYAFPGLRGRIVIRGGDDLRADVIGSGSELPSREVDPGADSVNLVQEYLEQAVSETLGTLRKGTGKLEQEIPQKWNETANAAGDSLISFGKKLKKEK